MATATVPGRLPPVLAAVYAAVWVWAAIEPVSPSDWLLENLLVFATVPLLVWSYRRRPLSGTAYAAIFAFFVLHAVGAHYTYSETPAGFWLQALLNLDRNHYDRVVHFGFGFLLALPARELIARTGAARKRWRLIFALNALVTGSAVYETVEWAVASVVSPETALAWLGTQGDVFDAQKDMVLAFAGAAAALAMAELFRPRSRQFDGCPDEVQGEGRR